jgi:antitoxin component YwqK of YwqJK toxin-antitoxin module
MSIENIEIKRAYYSNGHLSYELTYVNDIPHGRGRDYRADGKRNGDWNNSNGEQEGEQIEYEY